MSGIQVYVMEPGGDITDIMLKDLESEKDVTVVHKPYEIPCTFLSKIKKYHFHYKFNKLIELPFKSVWNKYSMLHKIKFDKRKTNVVLFNSFALQEYSAHIIQEFKKENPDVVFALYFSDTVASPVIKKATEICKEVSFNYIYSFDPVDAQKNNYIYTNSLYSKTKLDEIACPQNDLYFVGENKGRISILNKIYETALKEGLTLDFRILKVNNEDRINAEIKYTGRISYIDSLKELQDSKCILDIVQEGQTGTTLRYYEAVCYNKKLLTNNHSLREMKYYNPSYIQIFDSVQDIDWGWINNGEFVDYKYQNDYSPIFLIQDIKKRIHDLEGKSDNEQN